jgi:hypothetical protein
MNYQIEFDNFGEPVIELRLNKQQLRELMKLAPLGTKLSSDLMNIEADMFEAMEEE